MRERALCSPWPVVRLVIFAYLSACLADDLVPQILIVNLWEHQVGLYQGANMGLLKTVFEVNLGLFGKREE